MSSSPSTLGALQTALDSRGTSAALSLCEARVRNSPNDADAYRHLGQIHAMQGARQLALNASRRACELAPEEARNWCDLGRVHAGFAEFAPAVNCFSHAIQLDNKYADGWHNLGTALAKLGQKDLAFTALKTALSIDPTRAETYVNLGNLLIAAAQLDDAVECFERAARFDPQLAAARSRLAEQLSHRGKVRDAESLFRQSVGLNPDHVHGWLGLARALEDVGDAESARECYLNVLARVRNHPFALGQYLALLREAASDALHASARKILFDSDRADTLPRPTSHKWAPSVESVSSPERKPRASTSTHSPEPTPDESRALVGYGLAKYYDRRGEYAEAAMAGSAANAARRRACGGMDRQALRERVDGLIATYDREFFFERRQYGLGTDQPVFIVGLPRSGTTLSEQILSSHPQLHGAGELPELARLAVKALDEKQAAPWQAASFLTPMRSRELGLRYIRALRNGAPKRLLRISDKSPLNFFQLALAAVLFPNARVIHCTRGARDNALSIWMENFSPEHRYATDFDDLAFYRSQYERLMAHWREVLPLRMHELRYEDTVNDVESQARRLIDFLGAEWDSRCLDFHSNARAVQTPSRWQVRQPIYEKSVARWRHYAPHLPELGRAFPLPDATVS